MDFRDCGDCTSCCDGDIIGNAHGNIFGYHKPCIFLVRKKCSIYTDRPQSCHNFQCGWTQNLFPEWMKPNKCGILVSVEINKTDNIQFLRVIETRETIEYSVYAEIEKFCNENNTYYVKVPYESNSRDPRL
jgi:Fe-S-cluster containining protein